MSQLERAHNQSLDSESLFNHRSILFVGSESYDAPTITVLQGLSELGFDIYTIQKGNINSWWCGTIIEEPRCREFDFVLSNLHWGTRWKHYDQYDLNNQLCVLIDGDDNADLGTTWRDKYQYYGTRYEVDPPEDIKTRERMPYRWVEPLNGYRPDVVFTAQKQFADDESHYLPFGIHDQYYRLAESRSLEERSLDLSHIPGPGTRRKRMERLLAVLNSLRLLPGDIHNEEARGEAWYPEEIAHLVESDDNVHSYHRWKLYREYFAVLNDTRVLVYPGIDTWPFWDSKRPWEALACGCLVMMSRPVIDDREYPITELCEYVVYDSYREFIRKYRHLSRNPSELNKLRTEMVSRAQKFFSPTAVARYFLRTIADDRSA